MRPGEDGGASSDARRHAGVESDSLTVVAFDTEAELRGLLGTIGIKVGEDGLLRDGEGTVFECSSCDRQVPLGEVGHVLPGSTYIYCRDPVCILDYLERFG